MFTLIDQRSAVNPSMDQMNALRQGLTDIARQKQELTVLSQQTQGLTDTARRDRERQEQAQLARQTCRGEIPAGSSDSVKAHWQIGTGGGMTCILHDAELGKVTTSTWGLEITGTNTQFVKLDEMIHFTNKYEEHKRNIRDLARQTCLNQYSTGYTHVTVGDGHMSCYNSMLDGSGAKMISESNWTYNEQPNTNFWITKHYGRVRSE